MTTLLKVEKVVKRFGSLAAVNEVSFSVEAGEVLGIAGPNGSGKSTLFNILTGIPFPPDSGRVELEGRAVNGLRPYRIARAGLVRTFQKDSEFRSLSVRENVLVSVPGGGSGSGSGMGRAGRIEAALDRVGFDPSQRDRRAGDLSVFDRKRLMIATALVGAPKLLLLDEPASGLTKPEIDSLRDLLLQLNAQGLTILVIEHVLSLLMAVARRLVVLNEGRVLAQGDPSTVVRDERVVAAYLGGQASHAQSA